MTVQTCPNNPAIQYNDAITTQAEACGTGLTPGQPLPIDITTGLPDSISTVPLLPPVALPQPLAMPVPLFPTYTAPVANYTAPSPVMNMLPWALAGIGLFILWRERKA